MNSRALHIVIGLGTILIFLGTGVYMRTHFPELYASNEAIRYQFRANHIYILLSGLVNLVAGLYVKPAYSGWRRVISAIYTALLLLAPAVLVAAFFSEPIRGAAMRPITYFGVLMLLVGALFAHLPNIALHRTGKMAGRCADR